MLVKSLSSLVNTCTCKEIGTSHPTGTGPSQSSLYVSPHVASHLSESFTICLYCCCLVTKWHPTLNPPMHCGLTGFSVHGMSQARVLEWVAISFSRGSSRPRDQTPVSCLAVCFFTTEPLRKVIFALLHNELANVSSFLRFVCHHSK